MTENVIPFPYCKAIHTSNADGEECGGHCTIKEGVQHTNLDSHYCSNGHSFIRSSGDSKEKKVEKEAKKEKVEKKSKKPLSFMDIVKFPVPDDPSIPKCGALSMYTNTAHGPCVKQEGHEGMHRTKSGDDFWTARYETQGLASLPANIGDFTCDKCTVVEKSKYLANRHNQTNPGHLMTLSSSDSTEALGKCKDCDLLLFNQQSVTRHLSFNPDHKIRLLGKEKDSKAIGPEYQCTACDECSQDPNDIFEHMVVVHMRIILREKDEDGWVTSIIKDEGSPFPTDVGDAILKGSC